jgi:hypothetical protein
MDMDTDTGRGHGHGYENNLCWDVLVVSSPPLYVVKSSNYCQNLGFREMTIITVSYFYLRKTVSFIAFFGKQSDFRRD